MQIQDSIGRLVVGVLMIVAMALLFGVLFAFSVKWLWNDVIVGIFHLRQITTGEAWELMVLCSILFKSSSTSSSKK